MRSQRRNGQKSTPPAGPTGYGARVAAKLAADLLAQLGNKPFPHFLLLLGIVAG